MLVITGTQRSGTTAAASLFKEEGYDLGSDLWDEVGGLENETICAFYREYLGDPIFPFSNFPALDKRKPLDLSGPVSQHLLPEEEFSILDLPVVKFSMLCMNPAFVTIWSKFRPPSKGDRFLVMGRSKMSVISSKKASWRIFKQDSRLLQQTAGALRWNFRVSIGLLIDYGYPVSVMPFKSLMHNFCINDYLAQMGCDLRIKEETWKKVIDPGKVHFQ